MNLVLGVQRLHGGLRLFHGDTNDGLAITHDRRRSSRTCR